MIFIFLKPMRSHLCGGVNPAIENAGMGRLARDFTPGLITIY
jgi:hypothetical protein